MPQLTWPTILSGLVERQDLSVEAVEWAMNEILSGNATPVQMAGFMVALKAKGETVDEIRGLADAMRAHATPISLDSEAVDVVGSGGDRANTVNISTMAAIVTAASGRRVVKHGNRAASSMSGTADCLEALGVVLDVPPDRQREVFDEVGIAFLFAPLYHPSLRHAGPARKELGIPTTFNVLGPLTNPAHPAAQAIGIADARLAPVVAGVVAARGDRGMVFHGDDGLDELTTTTTSDVWLISQGHMVADEINPAALGVQPATPANLVGGNPAHNATVVRQVLSGAPGPVRDIVRLNAAAAMLAFDGPDLTVSVTDQLASRYAEAGQVIDSGAGSDLLDRWITATQRVTSR